MMEKASKAETKGIEFVLSCLSEARKKPASMNSEEKLRNTLRIWEAYCDIEQAIEVSKFVFRLHDQLGTIRTLEISEKTNPETTPVDELATKYRLANSDIESAEKACEKMNGESAIEFARKARDELKILLLGERKIKRRKDYP